MSEYSDFIFWLVAAVLLFIVIGAAYVWKKGLLGTATEERLKKIRHNVAESAKAELDRLDEAIAVKLAKKPEIPTLTAPLGRTDSIAKAVELRDKGEITQAQYEEIRDDLFKK